MEQLVQEGKITYVSSSNYAGWDIATTQLTAESRHFLGLVSEQSQYNFTNRDRTRTHPGTAALRHRTDPVEPPRHWRARRLPLHKRSPRCAKLRFSF